YVTSTGGKQVMAIKMDLNRQMVGFRGRIPFCLFASNLVPAFACDTCSPGQNPRYVRMDVD
ncbi:hypothetical protein QBC45DRAFT_319213, partial [Copromyces sp. CBS 386.78]